MDIRRVAVIYDDSLRPETTGTYCLRALSELVEVVHVRPDGLDRLERAGFDLYLNVDDGLEYRLPPDLRPSAWWAIDTHIDFARCAARARDCDLVFAAQRDGAARLDAEGIAPAVWLPLACDPAVHRRHEVAKRHDVAFVGNVFPGPRRALIDLLRTRYRSAFVGNAYFDEMAEIYSASRLVFNRSLLNDVNMRVFEALACGSLLLTDDLADNGLAELFRDGVHLATYRDEQDLLDKAAYYLAREAVRERIAAAGRDAVLAGHTYRHRMETLLRTAGSELGKARVKPAAVPREPSHDLSYFSHVRPEVMALVPESARRVLDVGCGAGRLGEAIRARQGASVVGIELDPVAAGMAEGRLDRVLVGDAERLEPGFEPGEFDCIVCGDVLEHLEDPGAFLRRARGWLGRGGVVAASVPNVRHHLVVASLLEGNWTYESAGLLDETHLGFFTRRDLFDLFERAGYRIEAAYIVPGPGHDEWRAAGSPGAVWVGRLHISGLAPEEAEEFYTYQFLVVATPESRSEAKLNPDPGNGSSRPDIEPGVGAFPIKTPEYSSSLSPPGPGEARRGGRKRMRFTQDFLTDFDQFDFHGPPFAFVRFGDGERSICRGVPLVNCDGWSYDGRASRFAADLNASLTHAASDYYVGISDGCCDRESRDWFLARLRVPLDQVTFANIFVNGNYRRFRRLDLSRTALVSSSGGDFTVPEHVINADFDLDGLVDRLLAVDRPILFAAGPASCVLIHKYWTRAGANRQTVVDIGSALDEVVKGRRTRGYHHPGSPTADRICRW
jgi:2-polyprenyl-3-methyl-5-hydroxy-6-metoxy-1,4-benzoquinol methylase